MLMKAAARREGERGRAAARKTGSAVSQTSGSKVGWDKNKNKSKKNKIIQSKSISIN